MADGDWKFVRVVLEQIEGRLDDPSSLAGLAEVEADLLSAVTAVGVIGNGGHLYWYEGKDGEDTLRTIAAFERMGLDTAAGALRQSLAAFPHGSPPVDLSTRQAYIQQHRDELKAAFQSLDEAVWGANFDEAAAAYIRARRSDLLKTYPGLTSHLALH
jgi:hypothetical protein